MPRGQTFGGTGGNTSATMQVLTGTMPLTVCDPLSFRLKDAVMPDGGPHVTVIGNGMTGRVAGVSFLTFFATMSDPSPIFSHFNVFTTVTVMGGPPLTTTTFDGV